jgi:uncharacterized delta-60 repeat protein
VILTVAALAATIVPALPAAATNAEGALDPSFSGDGRFVDTTSGQNAVTDGLVQPNGSMVASTEVGAPGPMGFSLVRYLPGGALDTTFGNGGVATIPGQSNGNVEAIARQSDGKLVAGGTDGTNGQMLIARFTVNGQLDPTFDGDGVKDMLLGTQSGLSNLTIAPDGSIYLVGDAVSSNVTYQFVAKLDSQGNVVQSFGPNRFSEFNAGSTFMSYDDAATFDYASSVAVMPDGSVMMGGQYGTTSSQQSTLWEVTSSGRFDTGFAGDGSLSDAVGSVSSRSDALLPTSDGGVLAAQYASDSSTATAVVSRYTAAGALDTQWGNGGRAYLAPGYARDLAMQPDGKILVTGTYIASDSDFFLARLTRAGGLDPTFATGGVSRVGFGVAQSDFPLALSVLPNGRAIAIGASADPNTYLEHPAIARWRYDATPPAAGVVRALPRFQTRLRTTLHWSAKDADTGVSRYDVQVRRAGSGQSSFGAWKTFRHLTTATKATLAGATGTTYCVRARGRDRAGNIGRFGAARCTAFPVDDRALSATGTWTAGRDSGDYAGTFRASAQLGAQLSRRIVYRHLALVVTTCPTCGRVRVTVGATTKTFNLHAATTHRRVVLPFASSSKVRTATVRITVASAHKVIVDGLAVSLV